MSDGLNFTDSIQNYDMPSRKAILQYLVRMGSWSAGPKIPNEDNGDEDALFPSSSTWNELIKRCEIEMNSRPIAGLCGWNNRIPRVLVDLGYSGDETIRIMQWNVLAHAIAEGIDGFVNCPPESLLWENRRWRLLAEIADVQPDIICMQEVDHFRFFEKAFSGVGLVGIFCPKPDSPCLHIPDNNGPDGCALFVNTLRYDILETNTRSLEIGTIQSNQVAIVCKLRRRSDGFELWVATTHLKAYSTVFMELLRGEQGCDLLDFLRSKAGDTSPLLLAGDMNAEPTERVHSLFKAAGLESAYFGQEPSYTTWTVRRDGEHCKTLDYIFYRSKSFQVQRLLRLPSENDIGPDRVPSRIYPSDHFALVADLFVVPQ